METLNVTLIEPRLKHPTIFERFDALSGGEGFVIHNDHDPKPLYYQLLGERGNIFDWEYLLNGPEIWEVKISKLITGEKPKTIGDLVAADFRKAEVFKSLGIDFCCGGKKTLEKACREKGLDITEVEKELKKVEVQPNVTSQNFQEWELDFLADYIVNTHHKYVENSLPALFEYTQKVARVHGNSHPETIQIADLFFTVRNELICHIGKEEGILFPYVKQLVQAKKHNTALEKPNFGTVQNPIDVMEHEHDSAGEIFRSIRLLANDFSPPEDACTTYKLSYSKLEEFDKDLQQHIHLENNILFPKALKLEKELLN
ncbi:MAG: iron-sulfur cluster repair di-iron protein [Bacteroidetes bacterium]|nr:iron-sulfur cluster repair di-iron protein [Bacteroidota bacterium]